jgi:sugar phosphate isomerase/epimerase
MGEYRMVEYQGGPNSLDPNKAYSNTFTGYRANAKNIGITVMPSANIVKEASTALSSGLQHIELPIISPELFDSMPKQQLKELNELTKLTGVDVSIHAPVVNMSGIGREGGYSDLARENTERMVANWLNRSHDVNPDGGTPVVFHSSEGAQGSEFKVLEGEEGRTYNKLTAIDRESGKMIPLDSDVKYYPGGEVRKKEMTPEDNLRTVNHTEWDNSLSQIEFNREHAMRVMQDVDPAFRELYVEWRAGEMRGIPLQRDLDEKEWGELKKLYSADEFMTQATVSANAAFNKAYTIAKKDNNEKELEYLQALSQQYGGQLGTEEKGPANLKQLDPGTQAEAMFHLISGLKKLDPRAYIPIEEFEIEKASQTFGNAVFKAYQQHGDTTPIVAIENPPAGFNLSTGEDLKNLVVKSRERFADNLVKEGMNKRQASKTAEKFIGATWDVGHINMLKKQGFTDKDILKETEKIAPYVKHVHLSDNFGFEHTELPMGMGNVPMKEIMEKLGKKGFEAKKIIEAKQWWDHFKTSPVKESLEGMGAPMYSSSTPATVGGMPYWNQSLGFQQSYGEGFGRMLPSINYQTFGAGFSQLPSHLGGEAQGGQGSRMSGKPME